MKTVLISIHPKWCELISDGKKTIEVRKSRPKIETPFKCYIYRTKGTYSVVSNGKWTRPKTVYGVIGEFVCDRIDTYTAEFVDDDCYEDIRYRYVDCEDEEQELVVASNWQDNSSDCALCEESCLTFGELKHYIGVCFHDKPFYAWHISDLVIYDKPKELREFKQCHRCHHVCVPKSRSLCKYHLLQRPPQSWCYVEELI